MTIRISTAIIALGTLVSGLQAQSLQDAITKTENERYEAAASDFKSLLGKDPNKSDYYFYYGENYFKNNELDSALIMYKKGAEVQATNGLNYVGIGKVYLWQGNETEGNSNLFKAKTLGSKDVTVMLKLAEAYTQVPTGKNLPEAIKLLQEVQKKDAKNPEAYILMGDALLEQNPTDGGPAIKQYEKAAELDKKSPKAMLRIGKLYQRGRSWDLALDYYKKAEAVDATFAPAYREKAELMYKAGRYQQAIDNYKKYLELNNSIAARDRYASFLYLNKQYKEAVTEIENIQTQDNSSPYLYRILGYAYYEMGDKENKEAFTKGLAAINTFFSKTEGKNFKYIADDYKYKGLLLAKTGSDSLGVIEIEKAIKQDEKNGCELNGEVAKIWLKAKRYDKAIAAFEKRSACGKAMSGQEYYDMGRAYFYGPKDFVKADTCFARLCQASPNYPIGYFWRGKANVQLDPKNEKWSAMPHYEKGLSLVKPEDRGSASYKNNVIEACEYLGYYYVVQKDNAKAKEYWEIVRTLDVNNKKAKDFFNSPAGK